MAVSTVGTQKHSWTKRLFRYGYDAMMERCAPDEVLLFGVMPEGLKGNIINAEAFVDQLRKRCTVDENKNEE